MGRMGLHLDAVMRLLRRHIVCTKLLNMVLAGER